VPPSIDGGDATETVEVLENQTAYLSCPAVGVPRPSITWYRDGAPIQVESSIFSVMHMQCMHVINNAYA